MLDTQNSSLAHKTRSSSTSLSSFLTSFFSFLQYRSKLMPIPIKTRNQLLVRPDLFNKAFFNRHCLSILFRRQYHITSFVNKDTLIHSLK